MMEITSDEVVAVSQLVRHLSRYLDQLKEHKISKLLLSRQSGLEAVLLPLKDYERLLDVQDQMDHLLLFRELKERERQDGGKRISRDRLKKKYGLDH